MLVPSSFGEPLPTRILLHEYRGLRGFGCFRKLVGGGIGFNPGPSCSDWGVLGGTQFTNPPTLRSWTSSGTAVRRNFHYLIKLTHPRFLSNPLRNGVLDLIFHLCQRSGASYVFFESTLGAGFERCGTRNGQGCPGTNGQIQTRGGSLK